MKLSYNKVKAPLFTIEDVLVRDFDKSGECLPAGLMATNDKNSFKYSQSLFNKTNAI